MGNRMAGYHTTTTYVYLFKAAQRALSQAQKDTEGQLYEVINSLVMAAFAVEAYLNHLIDVLKEDGVEISLPENRPSVWKKYSALSDACGLGSQKINVKYPEVAELLEFRNTMAHGRTETIQFDEIVDADEAPSTPSCAFPDWKSYAVIETAQLVLPRVESLIKELHEAAGKGKHPLLSLGIGLFAFTRPRIE